MRHAAVALQYDGECEQGSVFVACPCNIQVFGVAEIRRINVQETEYFLLRLFLGRTNLHLLLRHQVNHAFIFQVCQQVHVHDVSVVHIRYRKQRKFGIGVFTRHLVAVVARRFEHHILAHEHAGVYLEFAIVVQNLAVK